MKRKINTCHELLGASPKSRQGRQHQCHQLSGQGIGTDETNKNIRARGVNISMTMSLQATDKATVKPTHPSRGVNVTPPQKSQGQKSPLPIRKREHRPSLPTLQLVIPRLTLATLSQKQRRQFTMNRMRGHGPNNTQTKTFFTRPVTNNSETGSPNDKWQPRLTFLEIENKMAIEANQPRRTTSPKKRFHSDKDRMKSPILPTNKQAKQMGTHSPKNTQQTPNNRRGQEIRTGRKRSNSNPKHVVINTPSRKKRLLWAGATPHSKLFSQGRNLQVRINNQQVKTGNSSLQDGTSATDPITKPINENMDRLVGKERNSGTTQPMTIQEANKIMYFDNVPTHFLAHFNATLKVEII